MNLFKPNAWFPSYFSEHCRWGELLTRRLTLRDQSGRETSNTRQFMDDLHHSDKRRLPPIRSIEQLISNDRRTASFLSTLSDQMHFDAISCRVVRSSCMSPSFQAWELRSLQCSNKALRSGMLSWCGSRVVCRHFHVSSFSRNPAHQMPSHFQNSWSAMQRYVTIKCSSNTYMEFNTIHRQNTSRSIWSVSFRL